MSQPQTPDEVIAWAREMARGDIERHRKLGHDLNVYSTPGARNDWQRGFDNAPPRPWERTQEYDLMYQRGRAAARLLKEAA